MQAPPKVMNATSAPIPETEPEHPPSSLPMKPSFASSVVVSVVSVPLLVFALLLLLLVLLAWKTAAGNNLIAYPSTPRPSYYYVQKAMRPTLFSARISKFDWNEGETFEAELWLLNDMPESVCGKVRVTATVGDKTFDLIEWSADTGANSNKRGPTVRFTLPHADTNRITLLLSSEDGMSSEYVLLYRPHVKKNVLRQLNVSV